MKSFSRIRFVSSLLRVHVIRAQLTSSLQEPPAASLELLGAAPLANDGGDDDAAGDGLELPPLEYDPLFPDDDGPDEIWVDSFDEIPEEEEPSGTSDTPVEVDEPTSHTTASGPVDPSTLDTLPFEPNGIVPSSPHVPGDSQPVPAGVSLGSCRVVPMGASESEIEERIRFLQ